jgi:hypothetical protein
MPLERARLRLVMVAVQTFQDLSVNLNTLVFCKSSWFGG